MELQPPPDLKSHRPQCVVVENKQYTPICAFLAHFKALNFTGAGCVTSSQLSWLTIHNLLNYIMALQNAAQHHNGSN
jgi:hypothetical protein